MLGQGNFLHHTNDAKKHKVYRRFATGELVKTAKEDNRKWLVDDGAACFSMTYHMNKHIHLRF